MSELSQESKAAYEAYVKQRDKIDAGDAPWESLAEFFTEDAVFIDPGWGRIEGRENIRAFLPKAMAGLTESGFCTPEHWITTEGARIVSRWDQVLGSKPGGGDWRIPGMSLLYYAGDGLFCYEMDMLNMIHFAETAKAMQWQPPAGMNHPPKVVNRDVSLPARWQHLDT